MKNSPLTDDETKEYYILRYTEEAKYVPDPERNRDGFPISNKAHQHIVYQIITELKNPAEVRTYLQTEKNKDIEIKYVFLCR